MFSGNVAMYAACSAGFSAWLTGSPFILGDMGYSPSDIGLSYVPQTLAFLLVATVAAPRSAHQWQNPAAVAAGSLWCQHGGAVSGGHPDRSDAHHAADPILRDGAGQRRRLPDHGGECADAVPESSGKAAALQNTLQLGLCFVASMLVSAFIAQPLLATVTVMVSTVILAALGYFLQRGKSGRCAAKAAAGTC